MSNLVVTVSQRTSKGTQGWEGTVSFPGLTKAKLSSKTGTTLFSTRGALNTVARSVAKRFGLEVSYQEPQRKAAKKAPTKAKAPTQPTTTASN